MLSPFRHLSILDYLNGRTPCQPLLCKSIASYTMTTVDLLQRYSLYEKSVHNGTASYHTEPIKSKSEPIKPSPDPPQHFDAKAKLLHDMLNRVVKDLANSQSEPASEYEGTLWRSPLRPRSRSPAYSEISDSFESPGRIEHCTNDLLLTPISPTLSQLKGPDGWPLGVEVAINDFHRGRLSTPILEEKELPNRLVLRKQQQPTPRSGPFGDWGEQETVSCESVFVEHRCDDQHEQERMDANPSAFQASWSRMQLQQYGGKQAYAESVSLEPLASQQQSSTRPGQQSDCRQLQGRKGIRVPQVAQQRDGDSLSHPFCTTTFSARDTGDGDSSRENASTDLHVPVGLSLSNPSHQLSNIQFDKEEKLDPSHSQTDTTCLLYRDTASSNTLPCNTAAPGNAHQAEPRIHALANALDEQTRSSRPLDIFAISGVESIDCEIAGHNTVQDIRNGSSQAIALLTPKDSKANRDSEVVSWRTSSQLEDIVEEDLLTRPLMPDPQHFIPMPTQSLDLSKSNMAGERYDSMVASSESATGPYTLPSRPPYAPPPPKLTIKPSSRLQFESAQESRQRPMHAKPCESTLSAATKADLKDVTHKRGHFSAAALAKLRKTAESQPHFQDGPDSPKDQSLAAIHPLLRSKSFSRPFFQSKKVGNDSTLKFTYKDDDSEGHEAEEGDNDSPKSTIESYPLFSPEFYSTESSVIDRFVERDMSLNFGMVIEDNDIRKEDDAEDQEATCTESSNPQQSTLGSLSNNTLASSLENTETSSNFLSSDSPSPMNRLSMSAAESPDVIPSSIFQPSLSPVTTTFYTPSSTGSPSTYNSWAKTSRHLEQGNPYSTPSSGTSAPTSMVPTPNSPFCNNPSNSHEWGMKPSQSFKQHTAHSANPRGTPLTPSSSFGELADNKIDRRSISFSSMFARYHKARYPDLPTAATTDSTLSSKRLAGRGQEMEIANDPFISTHDSATQVLMNLRAPSEENLADTLTIGVGSFDTPTKRSSGRFGLQRRSLSLSGRLNTNDGLERALSTLIFNPHGTRLRKRDHSIAASIDSTSRSNSGSGRRHRRSLSMAANTVEQNWEIAPPPTSLHLRDEFSMQYRPGSLQADDDYASRKDTLQGMKQGLKKVFGRH